MEIFNKKELKEIRETYYSILEGYVYPDFFDKDYLKLDLKCFDSEAEDIIKISKSIIKKIDKALK